MALTNSLLGMNLSGVTADTPAPIFIDRMRMAAEQTRTQTGSGGPIGPIDAATGLNSGAGTIVRMLPLDPGKHEWLVRCDRNVSRVYLNLPGMKPIAPVDGVVRFSTGDDWKGRATEISITATGRVSKFQLMRADHAAAFDAGEIFNPDYVDKLKPFGLMRALDHNATNYDFGAAKKAAFPARRPLPTDAYFTTEKLGIPAELTAQLASKLGAKLWNTVHIMMPEAMALDTLHALDANAGGSAIDLELGNEESWTFHKTWVPAQAAAALGIAKPQYTDVLRWYGRRAGNLANMAASVSKRFRINLSAQPVNGSPDKTLAAILAGWDESKAPRSLIAGFANGGYLNLNYPPAVFDKVMAAFRANDSASFYALVASLLDPLKARHAAAAASCKAVGLAFKVYEERVSLTDFAPTITDPALRDALNAWVDPLIHSDRMADIEMQMVQNAADAGAIEQCIFQLSGTTTQYGSWGTVPHVSLPGYPIYDRLAPVAIRTKVDVVALAAQVAAMQAQLNDLSSLKQRLAEIQGQLASLAIA